MHPKRALYPGSFDPPTLGHVDVIERAAAVFPEIVVGVLSNPGKRAFLPPEERVALLAGALSHLPGVSVARFDGLLVEYMRRENIRVAIRGIRAFGDFEPELQMALLNRSLWPGMETIFMVPRPELGMISSSRVLEIASLGGDVSQMVPPAVLEALKRRLAAEKS